jgi:hypothetical protein
MSDMVKKLRERREKRELKKDADSAQLGKKRRLLIKLNQDLAAEAAEANAEEHETEANAEEHETEAKPEPPNLV